MKNYDNPDNWSDKDIERLAITLSPKKKAFTMHPREEDFYDYENGLANTQQIKYIEEHLQECEECHFLFFQSHLIESSPEDVSANLPPLIEPPIIFFQKCGAHIILRYDNGYWYSHCSEFGISEEEKTYQQAINTLLLDIEEHCNDLLAETTPLSKNLGDQKTFLLERGGMEWVKTFSIAVEDHCKSIEPQIESLSQRCNDERYRNIECKSDSLRRTKDLISDIVSVFLSTLLTPSPSYQYREISTEPLPKTLNFAIGDRTAEIVVVTLAEKATLNVNFGLSAVGTDNVERNFGATLVSESGNEIYGHFDDVSHGVYFENIQPGMYTLRAVVNVDDKQETLSPVDVWLVPSPEAEIILYANILSNLIALSLSIQIKNSPQLKFLCENIEQIEKSLPQLKSPSMLHETLQHLDSESISTGDVSNFIITRELIENISSDLNSIKESDVRFGVDIILEQLSDLALGMLRRKE